LSDPLEDKINAIRAPRKINIPTVMSREETAKVISLMNGIPQLIAKFLYGSGLRISEAVRLRVQDIDKEMKTIAVHSGKGNKDRITTYPESIIPFLKNHLSQVKIQHDNDLLKGYGEVYMLHALSRKYPNAEKQWGWQYVFPASKLSTDPRSGVIRRHHIDPSVVNKAIKSAATKARLKKKDQHPHLPP
jgi:integrase